MSDVWVVLYDSPQTRTVEVYGVYTTREKADQALAIQRKLRDDISIWNYDIQRAELE